MSLELPSRSLSRTSWLNCYLVARSRQIHPGHRSTRDRDHLVVAIIDAQIGTSLKIELIFEPRFDTRQLHRITCDNEAIVYKSTPLPLSTTHGNTSRHFLSLLCNAFRIPDTKILQASLHTPLAHQVVAILLIALAVQNIAEACKTMIFRDISHSTSELNRSNSYSHNRECRSSTHFVGLTGTRNVHCLGRLRWTSD